MMSEKTFFENNEMFYMELAEKGIGKIICSERELQDTLTEWNKYMEFSDSPMKSVELKFYIITATEQGNLNLTEWFEANFNDYFKYKFQLNKIDKDKTINLSGMFLNYIKHYNYHKQQKIIAYYENKEVFAVWIRKKESWEIKQ